MIKQRRHFGAAFALALCVAIGTLASTAAAGNPHGTPPGQAKQAEASTAVHATVAPAASASASVKAQGHAGTATHGHATTHTTVVSHTTVAAHTTLTAHSTVTSHTTAGASVPAAASVSGRAGAPGQLKKTAQASTTAGAAASVSGRASARGQLKKTTQPSTSVTAAATSPTVSTQAQTQLSKFSGCTASPTQGAGVQPNSTTLHWTCAAATSNQTKLYGNDLTAGAIAVSRGGAGAMLFGPGNSQPHKVLACANGHAHLVDVHAVKSYSSATCQAGVTGVVGSTSPTTSTSLTVAATQPSTSAVANVAANTVANVAANTTASNNSANAGGTKAAEHAKAAAAGKAPAANGTSPASNQGVLGAAANQQLPFTGLQLWIVVLAAAGLIAGGLALRRVGRTVA
jgi:hypothetical protein